MGKIEESYIYSSSSSNSEIVHKDYEDEKRILLSEGDE